MQKDIVIQSNSDGLHNAEVFIMQVCDDNNVSNNLSLISVAVLEAVKNAIVHGNRNDASKWVRLSWGHCKGGLFFEVLDQGEGFDFLSYYPSSFPEGKGEGIYTMYTLADEVIYSETGNKIHLEFKIDGIEESNATNRRLSLARYFSPAIKV